MRDSFVSLEDWAGATNLTLTLVFTDIVKSTEIAKKLGDVRWIRNVSLHFLTGREIAAGYDSYVVKAIGDALMIAFKAPSDAVNFAMAFATDTGVDYIGIRIGINSGEVQIRENDIYGLNVNLASRIQHALVGDGIMVAGSVRRDYEQRFGEETGIYFRANEKELKGFGRETVFKLLSAELLDARAKVALARGRLLENWQVD